MRGSRVTQATYDKSLEYSTPLINDLKTKFFKNKNKKKGVGITDLINRIV